LRVLGPDQTVNGVVWRQVEDPAGNQGWIPAQYTQAES
jgi:SH3-like domain-containing protein